MTITRRAILGAAASTAAVATTVSFAQTKPPPQRPRPIALKSIAGNAQPITAQERQARLAKVQGLMQEKKMERWLRLKMIGLVLKRMDLVLKRMDLVLDSQGFESEGLYIIYFDI